MHQRHRSSFWASNGGECHLSCMRTAINLDWLGLLRSIIEGVRSDDDEFILCAYRLSQGNAELPEQTWTITNEQRDFVSSTLLNDHAA